MRLVFDIRRFAWVPLMVLLLGSADTHGALFKRTGADIYKQQCAKCHAPHMPEPGVGPATCRACHAQLSAKSHPTPPQQCVSCHLFGGMRAP